MITDKGNMTNILKETHNWTMFSEVTVPPRLLPTNAGLNTKNTTWWNKYFTVVRCNTISASKEELEINLLYSFASLCSRPLCQHFREQDIIPVQSQGALSKLALKQLTKDLKMPSLFGKELLQPPSPMLCNPYTVQRAMKVCVYAVIWCNFLSNNKNQIRSHPLWKRPDKVNIKMFLPYKELLIV